LKQSHLINQIELATEYVYNYEKAITSYDFCSWWEERFRKETDKLINADNKIVVENLVNFRGKQLFVSDRPSAKLKSFYSNHKLYYCLIKVVNLVFGRKRGSIQEALDTFEVVEKMGFLELLKKYPSPDIGHPLNINYKGYTFTNRYIRHIYNLGLFKQYLKDKVDDDFVALDIGSSYGLFSSMMKHEMHKSHHVLVDMPGPLTLAYYYLACLFPDAKLAGFDVVGRERRIDRNFIKKYDFVFVPISMYDKLTAHSVDLVTNFSSLSEMSKNWFDKYIQSEVFKTSPFFFTINRYDAYPTFRDNITILDYPLGDFETIYMRTCPFLLYYYKGFLLFWYKRVNYPSSLFQFIGKRVKKQAL